MTTIKVTPEHLIAVSKKFELALQTVMQMNSKLSQHISFMERFWEGITKEQFYYRFQISQKNMNEFVTLTDSIAKELRHHADKFRLTDLLETGNIDASCLPPPPNSCSVPAPDTRNAFQKSADSLAELGQDFVVANSERYEKKFDSFWSFMDYMTYGIPKGMYQGYMERAAKQNDSWNDMLNFGTFGVTGMIQGAFNPTNAWSKEHWANMIGTAGLMIGSTSTKALIKPKNLLEGSVKYEGAKSTSNILKDSEQHPALGREFYRDIGEEFRKNPDDPLKEVIGPGRESHPQEWNKIIDELHSEGVEVIYKGNTMAYSPSKGGPGQLIIDEDASIGALIHEYTHYLDDSKHGFPGMSYHFQTINRVKMELNAYMREIKIAEDLGRNDIANMLFENYIQERKLLTSHLK
ncbi:WXG100 family type VII secretion target [Paenibacillus polymyxa]|uniref:WXG100 family type VII secretion target n=1 Tax=Paenibacillus polymyxa TaxID=1406 RepID=UPI002ED6011E|nr:WXG100 family type VII secretion target [Paenibacillus polymyxa]